MSKIQHSSRLTRSSNVTSPKLRHISSKLQRLHLRFRVKLSSIDTSDFVGRRRVLEIQDGSQITGSTNNFAGFTDTYVVLKPIQGFMTMYETSKYSAIMVDATSCRKSKMPAN